MGIQTSLLAIVVAACQLVYMVGMSVLLTLWR